MHIPPTPSPLVKTLPNGVRLLAVRLPHLRSASVGVFLRVGSGDETPASNGISHVLEHMAFKGTAHRDVQAINLDAERLGADVNAFTSKDTTGYFMSGLGRHADAFLEMVADIVLNSVFPEVELARELEVIRQEAIEYDEDPEESASTLLDRALWGDAPLGMPVIGTVENIARFTRDDLRAHVRRHYVAGKTIVAAAGDIDPEAFLAQAQRLFAGMRTGDDSRPAATSAPPQPVGGALGRRFGQVSQVFLNVAWPLGPAHAGDTRDARWRVAASAAAMLFGGGMSAPLTDTVRERLGLAYSVGSSMEHGAAWNDFLVHATTTPDKLEQVLSATGTLLHEHARGIDPVHLERARNQLMVSRVRTLERSYATLERAVEELFVDGAVAAPQDPLAMIDSLRDYEVQAVFESMLARRPALAIAGKNASGKAARQLAATLASTA
ncbi:MAG TPA: pitrilysin family protein [Ramlibacter sp.]|nr:pitrilysin family protein [Ramlibacter sp.]